MANFAPPPETDDVDHLQQIARLQHAQLTRALTIIEQQSVELERLRGSVTNAELELRLAQLNEGGSESDEQAERPRKEDKPRKKRDKFGPTPQPDLEVERELFELDEADQVCTACGGSLEPIKGQFEASEMVDLVEIRYVLKKVERQKYRCRCGGCVETAPGPERAVSGGRYSLDVGLKVAVDKYLDHLPLHRQARIMKRHGLGVTSQSLWQQLYPLACELESHYEALRAHILDQEVIGLDQTRWPNLKKGRPKPWQMWALTSTNAIYHAICDDKGLGTFEALVGDFSGVIVADCLSTHLSAERHSTARDGPEGAFTHAACWAHILRRFRDCVDDYPIAAEMLAMIGELYDIDAKARSQAERTALRVTESAQVIKRMHEWLGALKVPSQLALGEAALHTLNHWNRLKVFVDNPKVWLDNNHTERALRGPVVGRRNHFGSKSRRGTHVAAIFYSLMESAKLSDVDPHAYLREAIRLARMTDGRELLMPWKMAAASAA